MKPQSFMSTALRGACASFLGLACGYAGAQANVTGQWTSVKELSFAPVHNVVLTNGKVMLWGKNYGQALWDPVTNAVSTLPNPGYDLFCAGHSRLPDGRIIVTGGHITDYVGLAKTSIYDAVTGTWSPVPDMNAGRWYPTNTTLPSGETLVVSGQVDGTQGTNPLPQVYQPATNSWRNLTSAQLSQHPYPMMFVAPNGKVFDAGPTTATRYLDTTGTGQWTFVANRAFSWRDYGSAVMYEPGKIIVAGGGSYPPTETAEVIDLNAPTPTWRFTQSMSIGRRHLNMTLLPDGTVLATGGTSGWGFNDETAPVTYAELWNPATEAWTRMADSQFPRLYHSSAFLLPDGRVATTGGDGYGNVQIYSPPYLFKGTRPTISGAPSAASYGQRFTLTSAQAADIRKVTLIRLSSVTHALDMDQRLNVLPFTAGSGTLDVTLPASPNLAPPGHYWLFAVNSAGVPSLGALVQLGGSGSTTPPPAPPPALSSMSPSSATAGGPAFTLTVNGSNFVTGAVVRWNGAPRATSFIGATRLTATIGAGDIAAAQTAQVSVANPDGAVTGSLAFTVSATSPPPPPPPPPPSGFTLSVSKMGTHPQWGTVTSSPSGVSCGATCSGVFSSGATVTLTASSGKGGFAGWGGACTGTQPTCTLTMNGDKAVTATFNRR